MTPQLLSARAAVRRTRIPWCELRRTLEESGARVIRIGSRDRVAEDDLLALIERARQPTVAEVAVQLDLALAETLAEMGLPPKRARRHGGTRGGRR